MPRDTHALPESLMGMDVPAAIEWIASEAGAGYLIYHSTLTVFAPHSLDHPIARQIGRWLIANRAEIQAYLMETYISEPLGATIVVESAEVRASKRAPKNVTPEVEPDLDFEDSEESEDFVDIDELFDEPVARWADRDVDRSARLDSARDELNKLAESYDLPPRTSKFYSGHDARRAA